METPVIIAGGGIGGLTAGIALSRAGYKVRIIEQASEFKAIGYGIQLGPNAHHAYEKLGIDAQILKYCSLPDNGMLKDMLTGETIARLPMGAEMKRRYGQPYGVILRSDLHDVLVAACKEAGVELVTDCRLDSYADDGDSVLLETSQGEMETEAFIAADGVNSLVRQKMIGPESPEKLGYVAFRATRPITDIPAHLAKNEVALWCGPAFHMIHYPLRGGSIFNLVIGFDYSYKAEEEVGLSYKERIIRRFDDAHADAKDLLPFIDYSRFWEIAAINPISKWSVGRVTLLGDSAHSMVQAAAQGACQAIEDCISLISCLEEKSGDFAAAFVEMNRRRVLRATKVQYTSRFMWELIHARGAYTDFRANAMAQLSPNDLLESLSWLYDKNEIGLY